MDSIFALDLWPNLTGSGIANEKNGPAKKAVYKSLPEKIGWIITRRHRASQLRA
jgi:hypothetical protein